MIWRFWTVSGLVIVIGAWVLAVPLAPSPDPISASAIAGYRAAKLMPAPGAFTLSGEVGHTVFELPAEDARHLEEAKAALAATGAMPGMDPSMKMEMTDGGAMKMPADDSAMKMPAGDTAMKMPADGDAMKMPADGDAMKMPAGDTAMKMPAGDTAMKMPADGDAMKMPADGDAMKMPAGDTAMKMPADDGAMKMSAGDTAMKMSADDGAMKMPADGDAMKMPAGDTAMKMPSDGDQAHAMRMESADGGAGHGGMAMETDEGAGGGHGGGGMAAGITIREAAKMAAGEPGPATDRTVKLEMREWGFSPANLMVKPGETIRLVVTNAGNLPHEFMVMDGAAMQAVDYRLERADWSLTEHEAIYERPVVMPGDTLELIVRVHRPGMWMVMCMFPYHMQFGMMAMIMTEGAGGAMSMDHSRM